MKLSDFTDVFVFPNRLLFSQRADDTGGKEGQHIVQMIDWGGGWGELPKCWREQFRKKEK